MNTFKTTGIALAIAALLAAGCREQENSQYK